MTSRNGNLTLERATVATGVAILAVFSSGVQAEPNIGGNAASSEMSSTFAYDDATAEPMPLPMTDMAPVSDSEAASMKLNLGTSGFSPGARGNGKMSPVVLGSRIPTGAGEGIAPQQFGTSKHPFTTSRVDLSSNTVSKLYPYRAAGKLYFRDGTGSFICSASLIKKGVIVTAAHCVSDFGKRKFYSNFQFVPARYDSLAPYGVWNGVRWWVKPSYFNGTDTCAASAPGVVCTNDVAVIVLAAQNRAYPGTSTGYFGYGWGGWGFTSTKRALFNQLGYPGALDSGLRMQRTDSQAFVSAAQANNSVWGSLQTGGSSGGPELVNLGLKPVLNGTEFGTFSDPNVVVGVTSWGYTDGVTKQQGASPFTANNIVSLVKTACTAVPAACSP